MGGSVRADAYWQAKSEDGRTYEENGTVVRSWLCTTTCWFLKWAVSGLCGCLYAVVGGPDPREVTWSIKWIEVQRENHT